MGGTEQMPMDVAQYGLGFFVVAVLGWIIVQVFAPRRKSPDVEQLTRVIRENTEAMTRLTTLIEQQGQVLERQAELLSQLRVEIARKAG